MQLKERIFSGKSSKFSLEEILESITRETIKIPIFKAETSHRNIAKLEEQVFLVENVKSDIFLYEIADDLYYVYTKQEEETIWKNYVKHESKQEKDYGMFVPSGVMVRRVPQNILGNGVLGRAFIHSNYIEILDSLIGNEYLEVLTHEVLHIVHPDKGEMTIRQMTRYQVGTKTTYH
ncbi:MAG: hypothetical protein AABW92_00255 [Nanoarchaeota archaeon]